MKTIQNFINHKNWLIVVPARLGSCRLREKPLVDLGGKPLVVRTYENLKFFEEQGAKVVVATDSEKVMQVCERHNAEVTLTKSSHDSGTDRCLEVAQTFKRDFVLNVQGDEPFIDPEDLCNLMKCLEEDGELSIATLGYRSSSRSDFADPNTVKVVVDQNWRALYFSRASVPCDVRRQKEDGAFDFIEHIGVYAYGYSGLEKFCSFAKSPLESIEKLEQLRALENGMSIKVAEAKKKTLGIDTDEDLQAAILLLRERKVD